jgi:ferredoxin
MEAGSDVLPKRDPRQVHVVPLDVVPKAAPPRPASSMQPPTSALAEEDALKVEAKANVPFQPAIVKEPEEPEEPEKPEEPEEPASSDAPVRNAHHAELFEGTDQAFTIHVVNEAEGIDIEFVCEPGENVLDAADRAGHDLPHSCRSGGCLSCSALMLEGDSVTGEQYVLEDEHLDAGFRLLCCTTVSQNSSFRSHQQDAVT